MKGSGAQRGTCMEARNVGVGSSRRVTGPQAAPHPRRALGRRAAIALAALAVATLALAPRAGAFVYWGGAHTVGRANLDGSGVNPTFITGVSTFSLGGVAVDGAHIYWPDADSSFTIGRANLDGSAPNHHFIATDD